MDAWLIADAAHVSGEKVFDILKEKCHGVMPRQILDVIDGKLLAVYLPHNLVIGRYIHHIVLLENSDCKIIMTCPAKAIQKQVERYSRAVSQTRITLIPNDSTCNEYIFVRLSVPVLTNNAQKLTANVQDKQIVDKLYKEHIVDGSELSKYLDDIPKYVRGNCLGFQYLKKHKLPRKIARKHIIDHMVKTTECGPDHDEYEDCVSTMRWLEEFCSGTIPISILDTITGNILGCTLPIKSSGKFDSVGIGWLKQELIITDNGKIIKTFPGNISGYINSCLDIPTGTPHTVRLYDKTVDAVWEFFDVPVKKMTLSNIKRLTARCEFLYEIKDVPENLDGNPLYQSTKPIVVQIERIDDGGKWEVGCNHIKQAQTICEYLDMVRFTEGNLLDMFRTGRLKRKKRVINS